MSAVTETVATREVAPACDLAIARFRLLARRRVEWLRHLWAQEGEPGGSVITPGEIQAILADRDSLEAETDWVRRQPWAGEWSADLRAIEDAQSEQSGDTTSRLVRLQQVFGLSAADRDLLEGCLAVALDPSLCRLCAYLQDHAGRPYVTQDLVARIYQHGRSGAWNAESAVYRWELVLSRDAGVGEPRAHTIDLQVRDWLEGRDTLPDALVGVSRLQPLRTPPASWPVGEVAAAVRRCLHVEPPAPIRVVVAGAAGSGRRSFAAAVCERLGLPLLTIDPDQLDDSTWRRTFMLAQRHAFLEGTAIGWAGENAARRAWPALVPWFPVQFVICEIAPDVTPVAGIVDYHVRMSAPTVDERCALWRAYVRSAADWPEGAAESLAERYRVHIGDIAAIGRLDVRSSQEAERSVREASRSRLGRLAQLLACPFDWDDLVVPTALREALEDFAFEARHRVAFWEQREPQRLFPQGQGLIALFSGPPGTGKTMATQVIAASLGYDLFRVDLASVVSKWVGETSQNFERILTRAADMHAMILFDECDAIFSRRTSEVHDAQDKFANTDAAYLLQAIESYPGIALLATNQKGNVDPAFIRRLRYVLEFAMPVAAERLDLWRKAVRGLCGDRLAALDPGLQVLAEAVEMTGAQIKYATLGAVFAARRDDAGVELRHLVRGLERELAKEGRAIGARERGRILEHGR